MSSIRVKLVFERPFARSSEQCWMLVDKTSCKLVRDLEYLIVKKFFVAGHAVLNLYLDDFLLPSQERIDVIRDNDVIRVSEDDSNVLNTENLGTASDKEIKNSRKRKYEESGDSKRKIKKAKHSPNKKTNDDDSVRDNLLSSNKRDSISTKTDSGSNSHKEKHKKRKNDDRTKNKSQSKVSSNIETNAKKKKLKKRQKKPSKDKSLTVKLNNFWDKLVGSHPVQWKPTFGAKKTSDLPECRPGTYAVKEGTQTNGIGEEMTADRRTVVHQTVSETVQKKKADSSKDRVEKDLTLNRSKTATTSRNIPRTSQGNHIRFDNEEEDATDLLNNALLPLTHPRVVTIRGAAQTPNQNGTPNLSPIEPDAPQTFPADNSSSGKDVVQGKQGGGRREQRKDWYSNKGLVMESTRVARDVQESHPDTNTVVEKDFSIFPLLHGPPRVGDTIAYKVLELSQSYTPELSRYKEGKVLSVDPLSKQLKLKLTKESFTRVKGDGHVSMKFEILEENEDEDQPQTTEEQSEEVEIQWTSMIDPRLLDAPSTTVS